jgi:hypothetical protein
MRSVLYKLIIATSLVASLFLINSCQKDHCKSTYRYTIYTPVYASLKALRAAVQSEAPRPIGTVGKIYLYGHYIFLNEQNKGVHIIDNSNPAAPNKFAFINIPGNLDIAVKGNVLYADSYLDLVALDISDPHAVKESKRLQAIFPHRNFSYYGIRSDSTSDSVIVDFLTRDTVVNVPCTGRDELILNEPNSFAQSGTKSSTISLGKGGSTARFTLLNNYLYTVGTWNLQAFDVQQPLEPVKQSDISLGGSVETIFPYNNYLLIGTTTGMFIYDASNPAAPTYKGAFSHARACDPVVAENNIAYVTLRTGTICGAANNELNVLDVKDLTQPALIKTYAMNSPYGLGIDGKRLFICEGANGLRFLDASDPGNIKTLKYLKGIEAYDVIPNNPVLLVTAKDGLYQYDYSDLRAPRLLSKLAITAQP